MPWYHCIAAFIHRHLAPMRVTWRNNLAILTAGLLGRRALVISELARAAMPELPESHRQRKKRIWRFIYNTNFAPMTAQCGLIPAICGLAGLKGLTHTQNLLEEIFIRRLLEHLSDTVRPLLLANRGFGRAGLLRFLQQMPRHTGRMVDYAVRVKGYVHIQIADGYQGLLRKYPVRRRSYVLLPGVRYRSDGASVVNLVWYWGKRHRDAWYSDAAGAVFSRWEAVF